MTFPVRAILAIVLVIGSSVPALAAGVVASREATDRLERRCDGASTQAETLGCYLAAAAKSRADVDRAFRRNLRTSIKLDRQFNAFARSKGIAGSSLSAQLKASQSAWIRYSQSQCSFEGGSSFGGSGTDILDAACHYRLNSKRSAELKAAGKFLGSPEQRGR
jgi:uncharacterized protein YecT (DUF1311 family)